MNRSLVVTIYGSSSIKIAHFVPICLQTWPPQGILVSDLLISKKSSHLKLLGQVNQHLVGICIKFAQNRMKGESLVLLTIVFSVLRFRDSDYPFGIVKLFLLHYIVDLYPHHPICYSNFDEVFPQRLCHNFKIKKTS